MKRFLFPAKAMVLATAVVAFSVVSAWAQQPRTAQSQPEMIPQARAAAGSAAGLATDKQKASYGVGLSIGGNMRNTQLTADDIDLPAVMRGLSDALSNAKPALSEQELQQVMMDFHKQITGRIQDKAKTVGDKNKKEGEAFLAANKTKDGVKTLPSGLQYKVLKSGNGPSPGPNDTVKANYKGTLLDGTVFDSSYDRGHPETFPVSGVIKGWTEALQLMKVGDKWQLFVPTNLAYGEHGAGSDIGPNAVLVFDVELLDVSKGENAPPGAYQQ